jgi:alkylglycerol monooxygenase
MWAVPFYAGMILLEVLVSYWQKRKLYNWPEMISNLACGVVQQIGDAVINLLIIPIYLMVYDQFAILELEVTLPIMLIFLVFKDFTYYWVHRWGHETSLWAIHLVHHQPKTYNFSVGLRMPLLHHVIDLWPMLLAALIGFPLEVFIPVTVIWASLQILSHTSYIKNEIPLFSKVFVTPSHHRVHHGKNGPYLDKNYGGIFSFWDRWFGTYQKECKSIPVEYGVLNEDQYTLNPVASNFVYWKNFKGILSARSFMVNMLLMTVAGALFILIAKYIPILIASLLGVGILYLFHYSSEHKLLFR